MFVSSVAVPGVEVEEGALIGVVRTGILGCRGSCVHTIGTVDRLGLEFSECVRVCAFVRE